MNFYGLKVRLFVCENRKPKVFSGFFVRSALYKVARGKFKEVLKESHDKKAPARIYPTPLLYENGKTAIKCKKGNMYFFDVYSFSYEVIESIKRAFIKLKEENKGIITAKDYALLILDLLFIGGKLKPKKISNVFCVEFTSPTSFRFPSFFKRGKTVYFPFPRPDLFVRSMLRTFKVNFGDPPSEWYESLFREVELIDLERVRVQTFCDFEGISYRGFTGKFYFEATSSQAKKALETLLPVAEISGVGASRPGGFGRMRVL